MKVYLKERTNYYFPVRYVLKIIEKNQSVRFTWVERPEAADLCWDDTHPASQPLALSFYDALATDDPDLRHATIFQEAPVIRTSSEEKDPIATVFYLINCLQEFNADQTQLDAFGRFAYQSSYQYRFGNIQENLVQREIDQFVKQHALSGVARKSTFFVSHDIDSLYGSWLQDGFWALRRLNIVTPAEPDRCGVCQTPFLEKHRPDHCPGYRTRRALDVLLAGQPGAGCAWYPERRLRYPAGKRPAGTSRPRRTHQRLAQVLLGDEYRRRTGESPPEQQ